MACVRACVRACARARAGKRLRVRSTSRSRGRNSQTFVLRSRAQNACFATPADIEFDCRMLADPHAGELRLHCGRRRGLHRRLQLHSGFVGLLQRIHIGLSSLRQKRTVIADFTCARGKHHSVGICEVVAELLRRSESAEVTVEHLTQLRCWQPHCQCPESTTPDVLGGTVQLWSALEDL